MYLGKPKTSSNIAWHMPQSNSCRINEELMQKSAHALSTTTDPLEKLRLLCLSRGAAGILGFARHFRQIDEDGYKRVNEEEFFHGIKVAGLDFSQEEAEQLFHSFDPDNNGTISVGDFLTHLRPPMSESRREVVNQVFRKLDTNEDGLVSIADIKRVFDVTSNPRYMSGEESAEMVMKMFLDTFEGGTEDGKVTLQEFMEYYSGLSVSIESDCYFDLMMRQAFKL